MHACQALGDIGLSHPFVVTATIIVVASRTNVGGDALSRSISNICDCEDGKNIHLVGINPLA